MSGPTFQLTWRRWRPIRPRRNGGNEWDPCRSHFPIEPPANGGPRWTRSFTPIESRPRSAAGSQGAKRNHTGIRVRSLRRQVHLQAGLLLAEFKCLPRRQQVRRDHLLVQSGNSKWNVRPFEHMHEDCFALHRGPNRVHALDGTIACPIDRLPVDGQPISDRSQPLLELRLNDPVGCGPTLSRKLPPRLATSTSARIRYWADLYSWSFLL
jgi:hypothetical protein